jgi:hypothetical protein
VPFTASHPALIVPLLRTGLPSSALVIGSMVPDLPLYLPFGPVDLPGGLAIGMASTHTPAALPSTDLAMGLVLWVAWHGLLAPAALAGAPATVRSRIAPSATTGLAARLRPRELAGVSAALLAASASHLIWDAFTHPDGWGARHLPVLGEPWHGMAGYLWAQYASDVAGALVLATWVALWWRRTPLAPRPEVVAGSTAGSTAGSSPEAAAGSTLTAALSWLVVAGSAAGAGLLAAAAVGRPLRDAAVAGAKSGGTAGLLVAVGVSAVVALRRARGAPPSR